MTLSTNATYDRILQEVQDYETIIIHRDTNPSVDTYGSQLGLKEILEINYPQKQVYAVGENINYLNTMGRMDEIPTDLYTQALVLVLGTSNRLMIDGDDWQMGEKIIEISHQDHKDAIDSLNLVCPNRAACSELIAEIVLYWKFKISERAAKILMFGFIEATSWFKVPNLTHNTFYIIAKLTEIFNDLGEIFEALRFIKPGDLALKRYITKHTKISANLVTWIFIPYSRQKKWGLESHRVSAMIGEVVDISPGEFTAMFVQQPDKTVYFLLHSKTRPAHLMADKYDGWGTYYAAEATLNNKKLIKEVLKELESEIF